VGRRCEIKNVGIANVQVQNFVALPLDIVGQANHVTNCVTEIVESLGGGDFAGLSCWHTKIVTAEIANRAGQNPTLLIRQNSESGLFFSVMGWAIAIICMIAAPLLLVWGWVKFFKMQERSHWRSIASAIALASPILSAVVWTALALAARAYPLSDRATGYWFVKVGIWIAIGGMVVGLAGRPRLIPFIIPACVGTVLFWFLSTIP
jgi:hypothetical protein